MTAGGMAVVDLPADDMTALIAYMESLKQQTESLTDG